MEHTRLSDYDLLNHAKHLAVGCYGRGIWLQEVKKQAATADATTSAEVMGLVQEVVG